MAAVIRLRREGTKNRPYYRIVVADSRARREGPFVEQLGTYDPLVEGCNWTIDLAKADDWVSKGARVSDAVGGIIRAAKRASAPA
jgi:small subunit ribosomal protein S16